MIKEDKYKNDSSQALRKVFPEASIKLEALLKYIGENDLKFLRTVFPNNKWKYLTKKLAYPYEIFNTLVDYQKPVDNLKKEHFFSKSKKCSS